MKQFTLLFVEDTDTMEVKIKVFLSYGDLLLYKEDNELIKNSRLRMVDTDGHILYCEANTTTLQQALDNIAVYSALHNGVLDDSIKVINKYLEALK